MSNTLAHSRFQRELLPAARRFYEGELGRVSRANRKGWGLASCPFHKSKSGKSFAVNVETGSFHCFGCDVHGGDVVSFVRQRYSLSFKEACQRLGCWEGAGRGRKVVPTRLVRYLVVEFVIDGEKYRAEILDEPRNQLQVMRRFYADAADRLTEIRNGTPETEDGEEDLQWGLLATTWELIRMEAENG